MEVGQEPREAGRQHGLARAGRSDQEEMVTAGRGHLEGALGRLLPAHVLEVHGEVLQLAQQRLGGHAVGLALNHAHNRAVEQFQHIQQ
jgi:hypothetical protein